MPMSPTPAQSEASRHNGACSAGPVTAAGKVRSALNCVRHGLTGRTFFLLPDEDPDEFKEHEATWLAAWRPRDFAEEDAALVAIRALWREIRADRLEALVLADLFAAGGIADEAERQAAKAAAMKALGRCCATGRGSRASSPWRCASSTRCASDVSPSRRPRGNTNPTALRNRSSRRRLRSPMDPSAASIGTSAGHWRRWNGRSSAGRLTNIP